MLARRNAAWFGGMVSLGLLLLLTSTLPVAPRLEERASELLSPLTSAAAGVLRPALDLLVHAGEVETLTRENVALRLENARLESEAVALRERALAASQVAALTDAAGQTLGRNIAAPVLLRDPSPSRQVLVVGRGRRDGVAIGQPALGPGPTLVGIVMQVEERSARVRLLSDRASAIPVLLERSRTPAALAGIGGTEALALELVPLHVPGVEGDLVLTSALGGQLPPGLPVGRVARAVAREPEILQTIEVKPLTDYARLEHVLILVDFHIDDSLSASTPPPGNRSSGAGE